MTRVYKACLERGLYPFVHWNVFAITPPLNITREELDEGLEILDDVLTIADEYTAA
jgi:taurine--2-oxoglutarate transaminase